MEKSFGFSVHPLNKFYSFLSQTAQIADIKVGSEWSSEAKNAELHNAFNLKEKGGPLGLPAQPETELLLLSQSDH